jgi:hypothetical protein
VTVHQLAFLAAAAWGMAGLIWAADWFMGRKR